MGAYHEASHAVFSEDLGCSPRYIDVGPQWGVEHGGCLDESTWYSVMAAGGAATWLCGEDTNQLDPSVGAYESAGASGAIDGLGEGDFGNLLKLLLEVEQETSTGLDPYYAPSVEQARDRFQSEIAQIAGTLKGDMCLRKRIDKLASHLYNQHCAGIERINRSEFIDFLAAGGMQSEQRSDGAQVVPKSGDPS
jgi:hypothetical protein